MDKRLQQLADLRKYISNAEYETTILFQNLQWSQKTILEKKPMVSCSFNVNHKVPEETLKVHEQCCYLSHNGYSKDDVFLPDPVDLNSNTTVTLSKADITGIINRAAQTDPSFKRGEDCEGPEPLTVERLQQVYTRDERRAIHDAVVNAAPSCHDLTDLALIGSNGKDKSTKPKSRMEILSELRDMKRRRTKYRVAAKTSNYSHILKDVIKTQMELYAEANGIPIKTEYGNTTYVSLNNTQQKKHERSDDSDYRTRERQHENYRMRDKDRNIDRSRGSSIVTIKQERITPESIQDTRERHDNSRKCDKDRYMKDRRDDRRYESGRNRDRHRRYDREEYRSNERSEYTDKKSESRHRDNSRSHRDKGYKRYYDVTVKDEPKDYYNERKRKH